MSDTAALPPPDVTVIVDGAQFRLHRLPLALKSSKFRAIFAAAPAAPAPQQVSIQGLAGRQNAFAAIVDHCYGRHVAVTEANAASLMLAARVLGVQGPLLAACEAAVEGAMLRAELAANPGPLVALVADLREGALRTAALQALRNVALKLGLQLGAPCLPAEAARTDQAVTDMARGLGTEDLAVVAAQLGSKAPPGFVDSLCLRHLAEKEGAEALLEMLGEPAGEEDPFRPPAATLLRAAALYRHPRLWRHLAAALEAEAEPSAALADLAPDLRAALFLEVLHCRRCLPRVLSALCSSGDVLAEVAPRLMPEDCAALIERLPERRAEFEALLRDIGERLAHEGETLTSREKHVEFSQWLDLCSCDERSLQILLDNDLCAPHAICRRALGIVSQLKGDIANLRIKRAALEREENLRKFWSTSFTSVSEERTHVMRMARQSSSESVRVNYRS